MNSIGNTCPKSSSTELALLYVFDCMFDSDSEHIELISCTSAFVGVNITCFAKYSPFPTLFDRFGNDSFTKSLTDFDLYTIESGSRIFPSTVGSRPSPTRSKDRLFDFRD